MTMLAFLDREDPGWSRAWACLTAEFGDPACEHEGEVWQYMGTAIEGETGRHEFRHRNLKGARRNVGYPTAPGDFLPR